MSNKINIGNLNISKCYLGSRDTKLYLGNNLVYPIVPSAPKFILVQSDSSIVSGVCNGSALTSAETVAYKATTVAATVGDCAQLGERAFDSFSALTSVTLHSGITSIPYNCFSYCSGLTSIDIPSGVTSIGNTAFEQSRSLTSVTFPSGIVDIGRQAFANCTGLQSITCLAPTPPTLGTSAFIYTNNCNIYVPSGSLEAYKTASGWSTYASRIQAIP